MITSLLFLSLSGQASLWHKDQIQATNDLKLKTGKTIVAVIDTGIDIHHPALKNSLWINVGETGLDKNKKDKSKNGIDDDGNGFIDDVQGWNFAGNNSDIKDDHGHGTHISGLISADSIEYSGISPRTQLMTLKYYDPQAPISGNLMNSVRAIKYAIKMGAHIINYSGGGLDPFEPEKQALLEAERKGIIVVAAAGNEQTNSDLIGFYPASYGLKNVISVTAIDPKGQRVPSSNWGPQGVHLSAPGEQILSTYPDGKLAKMTGTSQATAIVTGVLCQLRESRGSLTSMSQLIENLKSTAQFNNHLVGKIQNPVQVSLKRAIYMKEADTDDESEISNPKEKLRFP